MANDPAFLFYSGDYLRDTQCLSAPAQVAYDRIMCEHMRNICITQLRLNFFIKRLSDQEKEELLSVLHAEDGFYKIPWVAQSIEKRKAYSDSRRKNRTKSYVPHMKNICKHMENENENENKEAKVVKEVVSKNTFSPPDHLSHLWPDYIETRKNKRAVKTDSALQSIVDKLERLAPNNPEKQCEILQASIDGGWSSVFPLKGEFSKQKNSHSNEYDEYIPIPRLKI